MMIIYEVENKILCQKYFIIIGNDIQKTMQSMIPQEQKEHHYCGLLSCMQSIIEILRKELTVDQGNKVYTVTKQVFQNIKDVNKDGIALIGSLSTILGSNFNNHMNDFWQYLKFAFNKESEITLFRTTIQAVSDLARSSGQQFT